MVLNSIPQRIHQGASFWKFNKFWATSFSNLKRMLPSCAFNAATNRMPQPARCQLRLTCNASYTLELVRVARGAHVHSQGYRWKPQECTQDLRLPHHRRQNATVKWSSGREHMLEKQYILACQPAGKPWQLALAHTLHQLTSPDLGGLCNPLDPESLKSRLGHKHQPYAFVAPYHSPSICPPLCQDCIPFQLLLNPAVSCLLNPSPVIQT